MKLDLGLDKSNLVKVNFTIGKGSDEPCAAHQGMLVEKALSFDSIE